MRAYRKKLIEVGLPLVAINKESAREKSIRHGHPSTLHLWWARRPLAACRAVLFASLVDDPDSDPAYRKADGALDEERAGIKRADLFNLIEELVMWANSNNADVIRTARAEIARCVASWLIETGALNKDTAIGPNTTAHDLVKRGHCRPHPMGLDKKVGRVRFSFDVSRLPPAEVVNAFLAEHAPPVLDPFAGGGSIPLEAQRLGLRAYASDLNPVPVLINKALIEIPPKFSGRPPVNPASREGGSGTKGTKGKGKKSKTLIEHDWPGATGLAEDVRYYGRWMREEAEKRIGHLYPKVEVTAEMAQDRPDLLPYVGQKLTVIAWLWARTVASPNPAANGAHVPLVRSFWLSTKKGKEAYIEPVVERSYSDIGFAVRIGQPPNGADSMIGTVNRNGAVCLWTNSPIPLDHIRSEGKAGHLGTRLIAIVVDGGKSRIYLSPTKYDEIVAREAVPPDDIPDSDLPEAALGFRVQNYGMTKHRHLFTSRQLVALGALSNLVREVRDRVVLDTAGDQSYANAIALYAACAVSRAADYWSSLATWEVSSEFIGHTFTKQTLSMVWDYAECNPLSSATGNWLGATEWVARVIQRLPADAHGQVDQKDAAKLDGHGLLISTDPPYYDNVPYADLSDFFYVWLRRALHADYPDLLKTVLVPKAEELIAEPFRHGSKDGARKFFEDGMGQVFACMRRATAEAFPTTIYYAFKQAEDDDEQVDGGVNDSSSRSSTGWETFLQGLADTRWEIRGTWPIRTERSARTRSLGSNALASSIVLVCRPRPDNASLATRKEFIIALRRELPDALRNLQRGNIAPVDLAQAAIGPGMAIFTRYAKVLESDGGSMTVRTALGLINQTLDEVLAEQEGDFDGDTRWALAWFEHFGMDDGPFGDAETLSKAKNTAVNGLVEAGVVVARSGKVRLIRRDEIPADWSPATDKRLTMWEVTQHLIRMLETEGETAAAQLVNKLGGIAETARELAYRLYSICERKKWADEALAYNGLVIAWPELTKLALTERSRTRETQAEMF